MDEVNLHDKELHRLQQILLSFLVDGIAQAELDGSQTRLSAQITDSIGSAVSVAVDVAAKAQLSSLSQTAEALKDELVKTGGYDVHALAAALAKELRPSPEPRFNWTLIISAASILLALSAMAALAFTFWTSNRAPTLSEHSAQATRASLEQLCASFRQIELPPRANASTERAKAEGQPAETFPEAALLDLARDDLAALCSQ